MSIYVYQLGNFVLKTESSSVSNLRIDMKRSFRTDVNQSTDGTAVSFNNIMQLPAPQDITIQGTLVCRDCVSVSDQLNQLMSIGGAPYIDIIGYIPNPCCGGSGCAQCNNCRTGHPVTWVTTTGTINSITRNVEVSPRGIHSSEAVDVQISLTLDTYWLPVNRFLWSVVWGTDEVDLFERTSLLEYNEATLPKDPTGRFVFRRVNYQNWYTTLDPTLWSQDYFDQEEFSMSDFKRNVSPYRVNPNPRRWSAPPTAMYAFRNCPSSGQIRIDVSSEVSPGRIIDHTSTINFSQISSLLTTYGFPVLQPTDVLFAADNAFAPGFILRDGEPILIQNSSRLLKAEWTYVFQTPGQLIGRQNKVSFVGTSQYGIETAWLHQHRML